MNDVAKRCVGAERLVNEANKLRKMRWSQISNIAHVKNYQLWLVFFLFVAVAFGLAYIAGLVYDGWSGDLQLSRTLFMCYWLFITAALAIEGILTARFFSKVGDRSLPLLPFVIVFGIIGFCGLGPIGLMSLIGFVLIYTVPIFTIILLTFYIIEFFRDRRLS